MKRLLALIMLTLSISSHAKNEIPYSDTKTKPETPLQKIKRINLLKQACAAIKKAHISGIATVLGLGATTFTTTLLYDTLSQKSINTVTTNNTKEQLLLLAVALPFTAYSYYKNREARARLKDLEQEEEATKNIVNNYYQNTQKTNATFYGIGLICLWNETFNYYKNKADFRFRFLLPIQIIAAGCIGIQAGLQLYEINKLEKSLS
jgi:hypothetical protein